MPKYDFKCNECGSVVEHTLAYGENYGVVCNQCGGTMQKIFSAPSIHFKGGGWGGQ
jgi:putative FmdB family regulatory protein